MQIVIDIPEEEYRWIKKSDETVFANVASKECMLHAIRNGTPLPKGHGRLIDAADLAKAINRAWTLWEKKGEDCYLFADVITPLLVSRQTIIEAEVEE